MASGHRSAARCWCPRRLGELPVQRHALEREMSTVDVLGQSVAVKLARADGTIVNRSVEWDDVVAAAAELDMAAKEVLGLATAAAAEL